MSGVSRIGPSGGDIGDVSAADDAPPAQGTGSTPSDLGATVAATTTTTGVTRGAGAAAFADLRAILEFQLPASSGATAADASPAAAPAPDLRPGAHGPDVESVQQQLLRVGYDLGASGADAVFGRQTETAVRDAQRRAGLAQTGTVDAATRQALASREGPRICAAVGPNGRNDPVDVRAVQRKLQELGYFRGTPDGRFGSKTADAIRVFNSAVRGRDQVEGGREAASLEPGGETERWMRAENAPRWERVPRRGTGFENVDRERHDYGTSWLTEAVRGAGEAYERDYRASHPGARPIRTNDASAQAGGDTQDHATHETGLDLDIRLGDGGITYRSRSYDREATWAQISAFLDQPNVESVYFNDPTLIARAGAVPRYSGRVIPDAAGEHDNHVHVNVRPPARVE